MRSSGPPVNKLPNTVAEIAEFDGRCAAAQLWR